MLSKAKDLIATSPIQDSYTKLLLHMDGANNSTVFKDVATNKVVTANGNAKIVNTNVKFGTGSLYLDGVGDYLSIPYSPDFNFGTGDFTIDLWMRHQTQITDHFFFSSDITGGNQIFFGMIDATSELGIGRAAIAWDSKVTISLVSGNYYHIAMTRKSGSLRFFVNGVQIGATFTNNTDYIATGNVVIGRQGDNYYHTGHIDELRVSKGIARWTSNFTPPTRAY